MNLRGHPFTHPCNVTVTHPAHTWDGPDGAFGAFTVTYHCPGAPDPFGRDGSDIDEATGEPIVHDTYRDNEQHCGDPALHAGHNWLRWAGTTPRWCPGYNQQPPTGFDQYPILRIPRNINRLVVEAPDGPIVIEIER